MSGRKPVAYLDADILLHRAVSFCESEFDGEVMTDTKQAIYYFDLIKNTWLKDMGPTEDYFLVLSNGPNFRHKLYPAYKANRKDITPHPAFKGLKEWVKDLNGVIWEDGIEADDLIGIRVTEDTNRIAVSADKDFATIPCKLFIPASHGKDGSWHEFTEAQADRNWLIQSMTGDSVDNYKGIPGIGPVKAQAILPEGLSVEDMWHLTKSAFIQKKLSEEEALLMARLSRILRHGEYDFETKEVKLWTPDKK
jgi:DNA polymerase-1